MNRSANHHIHQLFTASTALTVQIRLQTS